VEWSRCGAESGPLVRIIFKHVVIFACTFRITCVLASILFLYSQNKIIIFFSLDFLRKCRELSEWYGPSFYFVANPLMLPFPMHVPYENKTLDMAQKVRTCWHG